MGFFVRDFVRLSILGCGTDIVFLASNKKQNVDLISIQFSTWFWSSASFVQVNLCQKLLFLHQLTHNMTINYKFNTWKLHAQNMGEHVANRNCFWHSGQLLYTTCSPHVLQKEELLTKIYLYLLHDSPH